MTVARIVRLLALTVLLSPISTRVWGQEQAAVPAPTIDPAAFAAWLADVRRDALDRGVSAATIDKAFTDLQPVARVLERDRQQAEFTLDLTAYLKRRLTVQTIRTARRKLKEHARVTAK